VKKEYKPLGLYIHIPFCKSKCIYCDFYSLPNHEEKMDRYVSVLCRQLEEIAPRTAAHAVDTVYFGGGTPSWLGVKRLRQILRTVEKHYRFAKKPEITLEANPDSAGDWKVLRALRRAGFNRLSLGVQSADDGLLKILGRPHTFAQAEEAVSAARKAKIRNLSLDLIYGLPGQTLESWKETLEKAAGLEPEHLSCYGLKVEEGTPLWDMRGTLDLPDDDAQADMYLWTVERLEELGYRQYEISNFAKPGYAGVPAVRDLQLRQARVRVTAQFEILDPGGVRGLRPRGPLRPGGRALRLRPGPGRLLPGGGGPGGHPLGK